MRGVLISFTAALSIALAAPAVVASMGRAQAQEPAAGAPEQIALTAQQIEDFLATEPEIAALLQKVPQGAQQPDPQVVAALDATAKKHGFANYAQFVEVVDNIGLVMAGVDPKTKKFVGATAVIKEEIAEVEADKTMSAEDKKEALGELNLRLRSPPPAPLPGNIALVLKYYDRLAAVAPQNE